MFITGISGFVGRTIANHAAKLGYDVAGIDTRGGIVDGIQVTKADIRNREEMLRLTKGADYVVHVAAITSNLEFEKNLGLCFDVNVNGFNSIIDAACTNGCKRFIYASSSAVYLDKFSESTVLDVHGQKNHYAKTKMINEMVGESYNDLGKIETVGMRYFNIYGPGEVQKGNYSSIVSIFLRAKMEGRPLVIYGDGRQSRDLIYVDDVAGVSLKLLTKGKPGIYNVGTGKSTSFNEIADMIGIEKTYVKNSLATYQMLTKADTKKLLGAIGDYRFVELKDGIKKVELAMKQ